jgi:hypothetical protein
MIGDSAVDGAYRFLRSCTTGDLRFDEHLRSIRFVVAPQGQLVAPVMVAMLTALETVLFVPEYSERAMELLVTLQAFDEHGESGALADRWRIYHGEPEDVRWALIDIETARREELVIDGAALMRPNPLSSDEATLCREMNRSRPEDLRRICLTAAGLEVEHPVMVGIDPFGIDVRRRFDVVRVEAAEPMPDAAAARRVLERMAREAIA